MNSRFTTSLALAFALASSVHAQVELPGEWVGLQMRDAQKAAAGQRKDGDISKASPLVRAASASLEAASSPQLARVRDNRTEAVRAAGSATAASR